MLELRLAAGLEIDCPGGLDRRLLPAIFRGYSGLLPCRSAVGFARAVVREVPGGHCSTSHRHINLPQPAVPARGHALADGCVHVR